LAPRAGLSIGLSNLALMKQEMLEYFVVAIAASLCGFVVYFLHTRSAGVARRVWVFPSALLTLALLYDWTTIHKWDYIFAGYFVRLPGSPPLETDLDGMFLFTIPAVASIAYALGNLCPAMTKVRPASSA